MILPLIAANRSRSLAVQDFYSLRRQFCREISRLLPVPATPVFWHDGLFLPGSGDRAGPSASFNRKVDALCISARPGRVDGLVVLPLLTGENDRLAVILHDIDPALTGKMASEWLEKLQGEIGRELSRIKQGYMHPETGLYNSRLLKIRLNSPGVDSGAIFLMSIIPRSPRTTTNLLKLIQVARLLESTVPGMFFYLGGNLFALYREGVGRDIALAMARRLLVRLKREGVRRVHIGIALNFGEQEGKRPDEAGLLGLCWQALEAAERRGPFSLCEASSILAGEKHPLAPPPGRVMRHLRKNWSGLERFGLLLFRSGDKLPAGEEKSGQIRFLLSGYPVVRLSEHELFVLLPGVTGVQTRRIGAGLHRDLAAELDAPLALGVCHWPCLDFSMSATARNCRRALMHGEFLGPDSMVVFDHVSLNVSGDYFFDEGDYRQAVRDYRAGLELAPDDINLLNSLGVALTELNHHSRALACFEQVLARNPHNFMALVNKGFALRMLGRDDEALVCFEKVARSRKFADSPVFVEISLQLGRIYCTGGGFAKAVRVLERVLKKKMERQGFHLYRLLGEAYAGAGQYRRGIEVLQHAVRLNPHDASSLGLLGELYAREGQGDEVALALAEKGVALNDKSWRNWYRLGRVRFLAGDLEGALAAVQESLKRNRKGRESLLLAGDIQVRLGRKSKAEMMYRRLVALYPDEKEARQALARTT